MTVAEAYRDEQLQLLRDELRDAHAQIESLKTSLALALDRAELAEERNRILREEINEARRTPFDD